MAGSIKTGRRPRSASRRARDPLTVEILRLIRAVPRGKVCSYGRIAAGAGRPGAARQVVRILHSCSDKERLPWHRIVNVRGGISLKPGAGAERQRRLLEREGVGFDERGRIDLARCLWTPPAEASPAEARDMKDFRRFLRRRRAARKA